jgi:cytoskeletal protein RodZ
MKIKMPKLSKNDNYQLIVAVILLVVVVFITAMPWASNTFHEALENMSTSSKNLSDEDEVVEDVEYSDEMNNEEEMDKNIEKDDAEEKEGFVGGSLFRDTATTFPGSVVDSTKWNNNANVDVSADYATPLDKNNLYMFNNAHFSPNCCSGPGSGLSSSLGCACLTNSDAFYITQGRGGGNMNPTEII